MTATDLVADDLAARRREGRALAAASARWSAAELARVKRALAVDVAAILPELDAAALDRLSYRDVLDLGALAATARAAGIEAEADTPRHDFQVTLWSDRWPMAADRH